MGSRAGVREEVSKMKIKRYTKIGGSYDKAAIRKAAKIQPDWIYKQCPVCKWGIHATGTTLYCGRCGVEMKEKASNE